MCRVFSCVVGRGCLLWPVCSLGNILLSFTLLHFVSLDQICLLLQVSLDFLLLHSNHLWWKESFFGVSSRKYINTTYIPVKTHSHPSLYSHSHPTIQPTADGEVLYLLLKNTYTKVFMVISLYGHISEGIYYGNGLAQQLQMQRSPIVSFL